MTRLWNNDLKQKIWADYLFPNLHQNNPNFSRLPVISEKEIEESIAYFETNACVIESNEDIFKAGTSFDNFHYQAKYGLSDTALLATL